MPRMLLSEEEAALINRQREVNDAHRGGWNKAILRAIELYEQGPQETNLAFVARLEAELRNG